MSGGQAVAVRRGRRPGLHRLLQQEEQGTLLPLWACEACDHARWIGTGVRQLPREGSGDSRVLQRVRRAQPGPPANEGRAGVRRVLPPPDCYVRPMPSRRAHPLSPVGAGAVRSVLPAAPAPLWGLRAGRPDPAAKLGSRRSRRLRGVLLGAEGRMRRVSPRPQVLRAQRPRPLVSGLRPKAAAPMRGLRPPTTCAAYRC